MTSHNSKIEVEILSQIESLKASRKELTALSTDEEIAAYEASQTRIEALYRRLDAIRDGSALKLIKTRSTQVQPEVTGKTVAWKLASLAVTAAVHAAYFFNLI